MPPGKTAFAEGQKNLQSVKKLPRLLRVYPAKICKAILGAYKVTLFQSLLTGSFYAVLAEGSLGSDCPLETVQVMLVFI